MPEVSKAEISRCEVANCCGRAQFVKIEEFFHSNRRTEVEFMRPQDQGVEKPRFGFGRPRETFRTFGVPSVRSIASQKKGWITTIPANLTLIELTNSPRFARLTPESQRKLNTIVDNPPAIMTPFHKNCPYR